MLPPAVDRSQERTKRKGTFFEQRPEGMVVSEVEFGMGGSGLGRLPSNGIQLDPAVVARLDFGDGTRLGPDRARGPYSFLMMTAGFAPAALKPWTITISTAITRMAAAEAKNGPQPIPAR